ncbi:IS4 family transposase, partial [Klebsiella pneumoniae]
IAMSRGTDLAKAMNNALAFLAQHCQRQNVKRDQISGVYKLLNNTNKSLG